MINWIIIKLSGKLQIIHGKSHFKNTFQDSHQWHSLSVSNQSKWTANSPIYNINAQQKLRHLEPCFILNSLKKYVKLRKLNTCQNL